MNEWKEDTAWEMKVILPSIEHGVDKFEVFTYRVTHMASVNL